MKVNPVAKIMTYNSAIQVKAKTAAVRKWIVDQPPDIRYEDSAYSFLSFLLIFVLYMKNDT